MNFRAIASHPYPKSSSEREILASSALIALLAYFLLAVFQPFGTYTYYHPHKYLLLLPYSLICFAAFASANLLLKKRLKEWHLLHEALKVVSVLALCSIVNYWYSAQAINNASYSIAGLAYMSVFTFSVGLPASATYLLGRYLYLRPTAAPHHPAAAEAPLNAAGPDIIRIQPLTGDALVLPKAAFLFAESEGNYCNVFYLDGQALTRQLLRISLKQLEAQVGGATIVRCHRSFIVNTEQITRARGNAQGYQLQLAHTDTLVPVSRSYIGVIPASKSKA